MRTYTHDDIDQLVEDLEATLDGMAEGYGTGNVHHLASELVRLVNAAPTTSAQAAGAGQLLHMQRRAQGMGVAMYFDAKTTHLLNRYAGSERLKA